MRPEQVDKVLEIGRRCISRTSSSTTRADCATTPSPSRWLTNSRPPWVAEYDAAHPGFFDAEGGARHGDGCRGDVHHLGHHRPAQGVIHLRGVGRPRAGRLRVRPPHRARGGAGLPAAGLDRPEHLFPTRSAGGGLLCQLPGGRRHGDGRPARDRPHYYPPPRSMRDPAHHRHHPHGGRRRLKRRMFPLHGTWRGRGRRALMEASTASRCRPSIACTRLGDLLVYGPCATGLA